MWGSGISVPSLGGSAQRVACASRDPQGVGGRGIFVPSLGGAAQTAPRASCDPQVANTIYLPKKVLALLQNPKSDKPIVKQDGSGITFIVADTGATDHMFPDKLAFILYYPIIGQ